MGPRLFSRGNIRKQGTNSLLNVLQWGRDSSVAEMVALLEFDRTLIGILQWGRDSSVAEITAYLKTSDKTNHLQWGRDSSVAEIA